MTSIAESMGIARVTTHDRMVRLKREVSFEDTHRCKGRGTGEASYLQGVKGNVDRRDIAQKICNFPYVVRCSPVIGTC